MTPAPCGPCSTPASGPAARCLPAEWELRVIVERRTLLSRRCPRGGDAFELAETWRRQMVQQHWTQIVPARE